MSSTTSRLGLYKPADDGSEYVDVSTDLNANLDKIDAAIGFIPATSGSPPSSPFAGMGRQDSDTSRIYYRDSTNSSWVQILSDGGTYNADLKLVSGKKIGVGVSSPSAVIDVLHTNSTDAPASFKASGDTNPRLVLNWDGIDLGSGSGATDLSVYRSGASELTVAGDLSIDADLNVSGLATVEDLTVIGDLVAPSIIGDVVVTGSVTATGVNSVKRVYKSASTTRTSNTTATDDPDLVVAVIAGATYLVRFVGMFGAVTAADVKTKWGFPTSSTGLRFCLGPEAAATSRDTVSMRVGVHQLNTEVAYGISSSTSYSGVMEEGTITTVNSGNISIQWAQNTSNGTGSILAESSFLEVIRLA